VLAAIDAAMRGVAAKDQNHALTLQLALAAAERDTRFQWQLRENPGRLRIQTIDALNAQITSRMPWLARFGGQPQVVEDASELYAEAARRTVELLEDEAELGDAVSCVALHLDNDLRRLRSMLVSLLAKRDQWLRHVGAGAGHEDLRAYLEESIALAIEPKLKAVEQALPPEAIPELVRCFNFAAETKGGAPWTGVAADAKRLAELLLTQGGQWRSTVTEKQGFPPSARGEKAAMMRVLGRLSREAELRAALRVAAELPKPEFKQRQWEALEALFVVLPTAAAQLKMVFRERRQVDFVEVAEAARRAMGDREAPTDLAMSLGERYEHLLVDEAQDTSISQVTLLELLVAGWSAGDGRTVFVVGDPMQSIYRFREADVGLFLKLRQDGLQEMRLEPLRLTANFRSRPEVTGWVNQAFEAVFPNREDITAGAVSYAASEPVREAARAVAVKVHPMFDPDMDVEAELIGKLAEESTGSRTAILVRARTHAVAIVEELKRRGIRYRAVNLDPLSARPVVNDLMALTRALLHVGDRTAWLAVLRAPWCGLRLNELLELAQAAGKGTILDALRSSQAPRAVRVREAMLAGLRSVRRAPLREVVQAVWMDLGGPLCLENAAAAEDARCFLALLERHDQAGELADVTMLEEHAGRLYAKPDPEAGGLVEIMTIHKAKGLEFDTVIVPGLGRGPGRDRRPLLRWCEVETKQGPRLLMAPIEASDDDEDALYEYLRKLEGEKARHETARLMYVAATRAREKLHLIGHVRQQEGVMKNPFPGSLLDLLWPAVQEAYEKEFAKGGAGGQMMLRLTSKLSQSIKRLAELPARVRATDEAAAGVLEDDGQTLERVVGTVTHGFLDRIGREGLEWWGAMGAQARAAAIEGVLLASGLSGDEVAEGVERVTSILQGVERSERGRWILARRDGASNELAVSRGDARQVIDRTFVEDGVRWIIDYKTGAGVGYREQLDSYARTLRAMERLPVRLGVYFPAADEWEEWSAEELAL
jgi:ATP-dependent exoDNAse (exonuclease V) beta subunit